MGSLWGHFGYMRVTLEPYLNQVDVERRSVAHVMGTCAGLVGPKSGNVDFRWFSGFCGNLNFLLCFRGQDWSQWLPRSPGIIFG